MFCWKLPLDHDESFIQGGRNESENELHGEEREKEDVTKKRHSLVHLYVENFDRRFDGLMKAVTSVNNGLLTIFKKNKSSEQSV